MLVCTVLVCAGVDNCMEGVAIRLELSANLSKFVIYATTIERITPMTAAMMVVRWLESAMSSPILLYRPQRIGA